MGKPLFSRCYSERDESMPKVLSALQIPAFLLVWTVILSVLAAAVYGAAGNGKQLAQDMLRYAPPDTTGLPAAEYQGVGQMTAGYLTGQEASFQYSFLDEEGNSHVCFQLHEADHMADCRGLIRLAGLLRWIFCAAALLCMGTGIMFRRYRKVFSSGMQKGLAATGIIIGLTAIWALTDFDGFFTTFHRIAFTNDGWLLDSRTDLLIRLMPIEFFIMQGLRVLIWTTAAALAVLGAAIIIRKDRPRNYKNDEL